MSVAAAGGGGETGTGGTPRPETEVGSVPDAPPEEAEWDTAEQVTALRDACGEELDPIFRDSATLRRFLRARKGVISDAKEMILRHQQWRREETPHWPASNVPLDTVRQELLSKKAYHHGFDKVGRPVCWVRVKLHEKGSPHVHELVRFMIEEGCARADAAHHTGQFTIVIDFLDFGYGNFDTDAAIYILKMLSHNFPERMAKLCFVRESWLFWAMWKVLEVFIDARTAKKILFLGHNYMPALSELIDPATIPAWLGGTSTYTFDPAHVLEPTAAGNENPYLTVRDGPRAHLPHVEGSSFPQKK